MKGLDQTSKIYVAGHKGMVGSAILRCLERQGFTNLLYASRSELDLMNTQQVNRFFAAEKPEYVFLAAAKVGGILSNDTYPADFLFDNLMIQNNVIHAAYEYKTQKLLFLGSSCIYPKMAPQPIKEESLLSGYLEKSNEAYAIAKIAGIKLCQAYYRQHKCRFISAMPTNMYGFRDNYHPENSHVLPALLRRFHEAKTDNKPEVAIWGSGKPLREFMFSDDLAEACVFLMKKYEESELINVGTGEEISILELAKLVAEVVGFKGKIIFDSTKPDGTPRKLMDSSKLHALGYRHKIALKEGIVMTYADFKSRKQKV